MPATEKPSTSIPDAITYSKRKMNIITFTMINFIFFKMIVKGSVSNFYFKRYKIFWGVNLLTITKRNGVYLRQQLPHSIRIDIVLMRLRYHRST